MQHYYEAIHCMKSQCPEENPAVSAVSTVQPQFPQSPFSSWCEQFSTQSAPGFTPNLSRPLLPPLPPSLSARQGKQQIRR